MADLCPDHRKRTQRSAPAEGQPGSRGLVVTYSPHERSLADTHERVSRSELGIRLAALKGFDFAGEHDASRHYDKPVYFVPSDTVTVERAHELGIRSEDDLFGGVAPSDFVATKAISHPLVDADAHAPAGWSRAFGERVCDVVLSGFSAFSHQDAHRAGARLLEVGPVRIKRVREAGGRGQIVVSKAADLNAILDALDPAELACTGLVLEQNLTAVTTYSVGHVRVADLTATYYGTQRLTTDNSGAAVYGGSDLTVTTGDFEALLRRMLPEDVRIAIASACAYDRAAMECFSGLFASRRNYDIARGRDSAGAWRWGVLEQSWRIGGASGAEIAALEAFRADPGLQLVRASTFEVYGACKSLPPDAIVSFCGIDERVGPMAKYALVLR